MSSNLRSAIESFIFMFFEKKTLMFESDFLTFVVFKVMSSDLQELFVRIQFTHFRVFSGRPSQEGLLTPTSDQYRKYNNIDVIIFYIIIMSEVWVAWDEPGPTLEISELEPDNFP